MPVPTPMTTQMTQIMERAAKLGGRVTSADLEELGSGRPGGRGRYTGTLAGLVGRHFLTPQTSIGAHVSMSAHYLTRSGVAWLYEVRGTVTDAEAATLLRSSCGRWAADLIERHGRDGDYRVSVHLTHCCAEHGCKYAGTRRSPYDWCAVRDGGQAQEYPCEQCDGTPAALLDVPSLPAADEDPSPMAPRDNLGRPVRPGYVVVWGDRPERWIVASWGRYNGGEDGWEWMLRLERERRNAADREGLQRAHALASVCRVIERAGDAPESRTTDELLHRLRELVSVRQGLAERTGLAVTDAAGDSAEWVGLFDELDYRMSHSTYPMPGAWGEHR